MTDRTKYKNQHSKDHYDRINLVVPKGQRAELKAFCDKMDISVNEYIKLLIMADTKGGASQLLSKLSRVTDEEIQLMDKWQISEKYRDMIQYIHYSKEDGYLIQLKKGYVNDVTGTRTIQATKVIEMRAILTKTRKLV